MKNYKSYNVEQFLNDEAFIRSVLEPTEESQLYWDSLIDAEVLDIYTYTDAVLILNSWKKATPVAGHEDLHDLWQRIENDIKKEKTACLREGRRKGWRTLVPLAAALSLVAASLAIIFLARKDAPSNPEDIQVEPGFILKTIAQKSNNVVILSQESEMELHGSNPDINYDNQGLMSIKGDYLEKTTEADTLDSAQGRDAREMEWNRIVVPYGKMASLNLSDGSILRINAGTSVAYPKVFDGDRREIHVDGEIFAKVAHDGRPFVVHTNSFDVAVTGTSFDLSAYSGDDFSHVVLVDGSVNVSSRSTDVTLTPGQAFMASGGNTFVQLVNTQLYTSWTKGVYTFENEPVENVLVKLSRFYNITLVLPSEPSGVICYGSLELKDNLKAILSGLMQIASFNFVIKDGVYTVQWERRN